MRVSLMSCLLMSFVMCFGAVCAADEYDPLKTAEGGNVRVVDLTASDARRERDIPLRVYLPAAVPTEDRGAVGKSPVVLFSHGLGGNREGSSFLGKHWAARGYVAVFLQHPGSDDSVWKEIPPRKRMEAMQAAATLENYMLRVQDVPAVLDQLAKWDAEAGPVFLQVRLDLENVGMSGHSFGAQTTQAVAGQAAALGGARFADPRIKAAVIMSPSVPRAGSAERAFGKIELPWLLMTGTRDSAPIGGQTIESRRDVYPALPAGDKYELVLDKAEHSAFTDRALPGEQEPRNPNHHRVILALSTAFWDSYLRHDPAAKSWLTGPGPRSVMQPADQWQQK